MSVFALVFNQSLMCDLDNEPRGGPDIVVDEETLKSMVEANPCTTVRIFATHFEVSLAVINQPLSAIGKEKNLDLGTTPTHPSSKIKYI